MTASDSQPGEKICAICHRDCSTRARTKDAAGRYYCRECVERAKTDRATRQQQESGTRHAADAAPLVIEPVSDSPDDTGFDVLAEAVNQASDVPALEIAPVHPPVVASQVQASRPQVAEPTRERNLLIPELPEFIKQPWFAFVLPAAILGLLFASGYKNPDHIKLFLMAQFVFSVVVGLLILIEAFRDGLGTALLTLCLPFYVLYYVLSVNENAHIKALFAVSLLSNLAVLLLIPGFAATLPTSPNAVP